MPKLKPRFSKITCPSSVISACSSEAVLIPTTRPKESKTAPPLIP